MESVNFALRLGAGGGAFASAKFATDKFGGSSWVTVDPFADLRSADPIVIEYGILGSSPTDLVAEPGSMTWAFNNGEWNSEQTLGFYSPLNAIKRGGFDFNIPIEFSFTPISPDIVYVGGQTNGRDGTATNLTTTFNLTGGVGSTPQTGDLVIVALGTATVGTDPTAAIKTHTGGTDYTLIGTELYADDSFDTNLRVAYRFMPATPETSFIVNSGGGVLDAFALVVHVFRNIDPAVLDVAATTATGINTVLPNPPAITPATPGSVVVAFGAGASTTGGTYSSSNLTNFLARTQADNNDISIGGGWVSWTSGAFDPVAFTSTGSAGVTTDSWCAMTIALRPLTNSTTYYKHRGRLAGIRVTPGAQEDRMTRCLSFDLMDDYSRLPVPPLDVQTDTTSSELVQMVLDALPPELRPNQRTIETGLDTFSLAFDRAREDSMTIRELLHEICSSDLSTIAIIGTTAPGGGLFAHRTRQYAATNTFVWHTFESDIARGGLVVPGSRDDLISRVQVFAHPIRTDTDPVVLYELQKTSTFIPPGKNIDYLFGGYRDPLNPGDNVGGFDMIPPVPTTDYLLNTLEDGTGIDLTDDLTVVASYTGSGVRYPTIQNNGTVGGYLIRLQARGKGIYRSTVVVEGDVPDVPYGHQVLQVEMPFQSDTNVASDVNSYLKNSLSRIYARVSSITFLANLNPTLLNLMLMREPGDRFAITEDVVGLDSEEFTISGVRLEIQGAANGPLVWCTWHLRPADTQKYWFAGIAGSSEAGLTTVPGF